MRNGGKVRILRRVSLRILPLLALFTVGAAACGSKLPEANSPGARAYVKHCAVDGCHSAIPPQQAGKGYWDAKLSTMLGLIQKSGRPTPTAEELEMIRAYLHKHAMRFTG
jgi:hypothetical protein